ncbi:unnamed protein product [marine sediment metagenome]|uniref:Response regulatory domain-containing protein n=1 Tax=marine sediment metagenome TaxID=412755 RepID=X1S1V1_9ZZZZ
MYSEKQYALRVLRSGASGYLTKESTPDRLGMAIRKVVAGGKYISPELGEELALRVGTDITLDYAPSSNQINIINKFRKYFSTVRN